MKTSLNRTALAVIGGVALFAGGAQALPTYATGSFAFSGFTSTTSDVTTTTAFTLNPDDISLGSPTGDFTAVTLPATEVPSGNPIDFASPGTFSFIDGSLGTFTATSAVLLGTSGGGTNNASATWDVLGTFTLGTDWADATDVLTANETWSLTQTGGVGSAVSFSGTFNSPAVLPPPPPGTPEPATLSLFGAALAGLGLARRRRK